MQEDDKTEIFNQHLPNKCKTLNCREILTTKESNKDIKCEECENILKHKKTNHMNNINCERCNQSFQLLFNLNKHQKECFYHCELCQFKHIQISKFKQHLKTHMKKESGTEGPPSKLNNRYNIDCEVCEKMSRAPPF